MAAAELKPLLNLSRRQPVSCVVALMRDKTAVILLDKKVKPRKLAAQMKRDAAGRKMELDANSVRFGRAAVDGQGDGSLVVFTLNKPPVGGMHQKVLAKIKPAGFQKCDFKVDEAVETEKNDDDLAAAGSHADADGTGTDTGGCAAGAGGQHPEAAGPGTGPAAEDDTGGRAEAGAGPGARAGAHADAAAPAPTGAEPAGGTDGAHAAAQPPGPDGAAPDRLPLTSRLTALVKRIGDAVAANPAARTALMQAATAAQAAMKSGDLAAASREANKLEALLGAPAPAGAGEAGAGQAGPQGMGAMAAGANGATPASQAAAPAPQPGGPAAQPPAANANAPARAAAAAGVRQGSPLFERGRQSWLAVRASVERDIEAVIKGLEHHVGQGSEDAKIVRANFEPILQRLDTSLSSKLAEIAKGADGAAHGKLVGEAQAIIQRYTAYVDGEPMVKMLDDNPVHPVRVRQTLDAALAALSKVVGTDAAGRRRAAGGPLRRRGRGDPASDGWAP
jgi:hypothetical protein